jgi:periplasmic protein TonB
MSEGAAKRSRSGSLRHLVLGAALAALVLCTAALVALFRPRPVPAGAATAAKASATVTVELAEVKREPSAGSATVLRVPAGTRVEIDRDLGLWIEIRSRDAKGYLPADALERDSDRDARRRRAGTVFSFPPVTGVVVEDAPLHLAPFPTAPRAGRLEKGATVLIHAVDRDYYALRGGDGGLAFVESASVDLIPPDPAVPAVAPARERALKDLAVTELAQPLPLPAGDEPPPEEPEPTPAPPPPGPPLEAPVEPATLLTKVDPTYPETARRAGAEGTVVLELTIGADGKVARVDVVRGLPFGLTEAASAAVSRWRYHAARGRTGPIVSRKQVRIDFRLRS